MHRRWKSQSLDGDVYAQPLVVGERVFIATENDTVYSLRAADGAIVWKRHLGSPVPASSLPCGDVDPVGITGTPVVDTRTNRLYAVGFVRPRRHVLFALDAGTGRVVASTPVDARGADPAVHNQRGALALIPGAVLVPYGGRYGDCGDYHGRVVGVALTARGFGHVVSYELPTQREGGFWAAPGPVVAGGGSVYLASGNSSSNTSYDYGNSVVRLTPQLRLADSWAPTDWAALNATDSDIGSTAPVLLPGDRVFQIGKRGRGYLLDARHLGGVGGELHAGDVCGGGSAFGGIARDGDVAFVPCGDEVVQVEIAGNRFAVGWNGSVPGAGPTVVADGAVWVIADRDERLVALDERSGRRLTSQALGRVPSRFTTPAIGDGLVIAAADRFVFAIGD